MKLEFSGSPEINGSREHVWSKLLDPDFVGASAPGVETVEAIDPTHFKVISGLGVGSVKVRFKLDVELFDIVERQSLKMRARGKAPGSMVDVVSSLQIADAGPGKVRLDWSATSEVSGTVASVGARLLEGTARKLTEEFWTDFARRVSAG
ncbi:MAG: SRPBCC family protein [Gemmatimonadales bacterium]